MVLHKNMQSSDKSFQSLLHHCYNYIWNWFNDTAFLANFLSQLISFYTILHVLLHYFDW